MWAEGSRHHQKQTRTRETALNKKTKTSSLYNQDTAYVQLQPLEERCFACLYRFLSLWNELNSDLSRSEFFFGGEQIANPCRPKL